VPFVIKNEIVLKIESIFTKNYIFVYKLDERKLNVIKSRKISGPSSPNILIRIFRAA
jgi:hypothetical protein